jgi:tellurite resistance protein TehA-like permease
MLATAPAQRPLLEHSARLPLAQLHPGNFAFVMASGILSIAFGQLGDAWVSDGLFVVALCSWLILLGLSTLRVFRHPGAVRADLLNPAMVFGFFTLVASSNIVGQLLLARALVPWAIACWVLAFVAWCLLLYLAFSVLTFLSHEHNVNIIHGGWLIAIVGTQSLVILGAGLVSHLGTWGIYMQVEIHMLWGLGLMFYGIFVTLFCYRIFFLSLKPDDVGPLLWVVMGAAAITTNAGTQLIAIPSPLPFLAAQRPFVDGVSMMMWAWATWWIPLLLLFGAWKHVVNRRALRYEPIMWSFVFPLGMYAVASLRLGLAADFAPLQWISQLMVWFASAAWVVVAVGLAKRLVRGR